MSTTTLHAPTSMAVRGLAPSPRLRDLLGALHLARRLHAGYRDRSRRIGEAAALRRYADSVRETDPRYAADLWAAADRHDQDL
ncbi:MAG TPA: hypothetical protein PLZ50_03160 [Rubrivivax sp.]|jgi:hypothetical protein|nr:hypothetical protein [Pseudomonadota bacterium]HPP82548.1 hypothetical protein [Rubrivivax sp.]